jgi:phosphoglycolate phosphatase
MEASRETSHGLAEEGQHMKQGPEDWPLAVVFDLDGTLIDSATDIAHALNAALGLRGLPPFSVDEVKAMIGGGVPKLAERALIARGVSRLGLLPLAADFVQHYRANLTTHTTLYDGARELLDRFLSEGRRLGLCANKREDLVIETLNQLDLAKYFPAVVGERFGRPRKPDPAPLLAVLRELGVPPSSAVMVGDSAADAGCARAAKVASVIVSFGYGPAGAGAPAGDTSAACLKELPACFKRLQSQKQTA